MSVHIGDGHVFLHEAIFEARFDEGYRYLDHCGEAIAQIRRHDRLWYPEQVSPVAGLLRHDTLPLRLVFDSNKFILHRLGPDPLLFEAEQFFESLATQSKDLYRIVASTLQVPSTTRIGMRMSAVAPSDSKEDASRFLVRSTKSKFSDFVTETTGDHPWSAHFFFRIENEDTGVRRTVMVEEFESRRRAEPDPGGFADDAIHKVGIEIDIDTFTRPASGHFSDVPSFVRGSFKRNRTLIKTMYEWMRHQ